jgi:lipopolysaccharide export LptBFGC system permease protein LptF
MSSSQLQTLSTNFNSLLNDYRTTYDEFIKNIDSKEKSVYYSAKLQKLNQQLLDINKEMSNTMNETYGSYVKNLDKSKEQEDALLQNYTVLEEEKQEIDQLVTQFQTLNSAQENGEINATMHYYNYIILLFIVILLVFLLIKFTAGSEQTGGGNKRNVYIIIAYLIGFFFGFYYIYI